MDASKHDPHTGDYVMCPRVRMKKSEKKISKVLRGSEYCRYCSYYQHKWKIATSGRPEQHVASPITRYPQVNNQKLALAQIGLVGNYGSPSKSPKFAFWRNMSTNENGLGFSNFYNSVFLSTKLICWGA